MIYNHRDPKPFIKWFSDNCHHNIKKIKFIHVDEETACLVVDALEASVLKHNHNYTFDLSNALKLVQL